MHSFRRAALRAACTQPARTAIISRRAFPLFNVISDTAARSVALPVARAFSVSRVLANAEENTDDSTTTTQQDTSQDALLNDPANGVFVKNIVFDAKEEHLTEAFSAYGNVLKATIARDPRGLSRGYGFIYFDNPESAKKAIEEVDGTFWHGRRIDCAPRVKMPKRTGRSGQTEERLPSKHLFIGNIPYETTDVELNKIFQSLDNLKDVRIAVDRTTGWPRGFAHADFFDVESATKAMNQIKTMQLMGKTLRVDYSSPPTRILYRGRAEENTEA